MRLIERRIGIDQLRADLDRAQGIARPAGTGHIDLLISDSDAAGRKLLAAVIASLRLRPAGVDEDELLAALRLIGQLADDKRRWLPGFSPSQFIDKKWRAHVVDTGRGRFDRRAYELCAAYELRTALRAGRVWVCPEAVATLIRPTCCCPTISGARQGPGSRVRSSSPSTPTSASTRSPASRRSFSCGSRTSGTQPHRRSWPTMMPTPIRTAAGCGS